MPIPNTRVDFETKSTMTNGSSIFTIFEGLKVEDVTLDATIRIAKALRSFILYSKTKIMNGEGAASEEIVAIRDYLPKIELTFIYYFLDALDKKVFRGTMFKSRAKEVMRLENGTLKRFLADEYECYELFEELLSGSNAFQNEVYQGDCDIAGSFFQTVFTEHFDTLGGKDGENAEAVLNAASGKSDVAELDASTLYSFIDELIFDTEKAQDLKSNIAKYTEYSADKHNPIKQVIGILFLGATLSQIAAIPREISGAELKKLRELCANTPKLREKDRGQQILRALKISQDGKAYIIDTKTEAEVQDFKNLIIKKMQGLADSLKESEQPDQQSITDQREDLIKQYTAGKISAREFEREDAKLRNEQLIYFQENQD